MMVDVKMFIPKTIKVGYQNRGGTYTGKLAYVIYVDDKGKVRKENSWNSWRDHKIKPEDFDNEPTSGFVLNKKAGGVSWSHWTRNTYVRVYDPRNFEFEISIPNLLFILQECSAIKGKGLEGEFVYAWSGTELVLLPVDCEEYKECVKHTERQKIKFDKKDLKEGFSYILKDGTEVLYLGRFPYNNKTYGSDFNPVGRKHVFLHLNKGKYDDPYIALSGFTKIAECTSSSAVPQYPDEYDKFRKSVYCADVKSVRVNKTTFSESYDGKTTLLVKEDDKYYVASVRRCYHGYYRRDNPEYYLNQSIKPFVPSVKNGTIILPSTSREVGQYTARELSAKEFYTITVVNEKGKSIRV